MADVRTLDRNALKFNEITIITLIALAFVFELVWLVLILTGILAVAAARPQWSPLRATYQRIILSLGVVRPRVVPGDFAPRRFTQGLAAAVLGLSAVALFGGLTVVGWGLAWLVALLAGISLFGNFCAGCFLFYQLRRAGILGRQQTA
jgi:hypothetical protein